MNSAREMWERELGVTLDPRPDTTKVIILDEVLDGRVWAIYIMGENTAVSDANGGKTRRALEAAEIHVVQDIFLTESAQMADVVLPAAPFAEVDGTFNNTEQRVQRVRKAIEPPGEAKADWLMLSELATRIGYPTSYDHPSQIWEELAHNAPILAGISHDRIELESIQWQCPTPDHPGTPYLHDESFVSEKGYLQAVPHVSRAEPPDDEYPLILTTGRRRSTYRTGTQARRAAGFNSLVSHEWAKVSTTDAGELGIADGDEIAVTSRRRAVHVQAMITDRSPAGVVFMSFHYPESTATNLLTTDAYDPITETPEFKACAVRIEKTA